MREDYAPYDVQGTIYESDRFDRYLAHRFNEGDLFLVATGAGDGDTPLGFAHVLPGETSVHLNHLILDHAARGHGHGGALMQAIIARAQKLQQPVTLDVNSRNRGAIRFYTSLGFRTKQETPVAMIPRRSGVFPLDLVKNSRDFERYGFCYADLHLSNHDIKIGIVGQRIVRLFVRSLPIDFDWKGFMDWAQWADIFVYGETNPQLDVNIQEQWSVLRMSH